MKYFNIFLVLVTLSFSAYAAQDTTLTERELRDPKQLEPWLEANASDAETRIAAIEGGTATVTQTADTLLVGNDASNQVAMPVTGDVTISQDGTNVTTAITAGSIVNADVNTNAAIAYSKLDLATSIAPSDLQAALADRIAYITVTGADLATNGTGTITIQLKDAAGSDLAAAALVRTWIGTANDYGVDALTDYSVSTGTQKEEVTANGEYLAITDGSGTIVMAIDNGGAGSVYAWAEVGGRIVASGEVALTAP